MSSEARDDFIRATFTLSKTDPLAWGNFIEAFKAYTADELERGLSAPSSEAAGSLGQGRRMKSLRDDFIGIQGLMDKIKK
jgi:hypothetical protein